MNPINGNSPYSSYYGAGDTAGNPALNAESERAKKIQADGLRLNNDAQQDTNVKEAAGKRR